MHQLAEDAQTREPLAGDRAEDDAAVFVATDGTCRGSTLESALHYLHNTQPKLNASDLELAQAILVQ